MKIRDQSSLTRPWTAITLAHTVGSESETIELKVYALPYNINRQFEAILEEPTAPVITRVNKSKGTEDRSSDFSDPKFLKALDEFNNLKQYYILYACLSSDEVKFDCGAPRDRESLLAVKAEIEAFGFVAGDVSAIMQAATNLSNISKELIEQARSSF